MAPAQQRLKDRPDLVGRARLLRARSGGRRDRHLERAADQPAEDGGVEARHDLACGLRLVYPAPVTDVVGLAGVVVLLAWQWLGGRQARAT